MVLLKRRILQLLFLLMFGVWIYLDFDCALDRPLSVPSPNTLSLRKGEGILALARTLKKNHFLGEPLGFLIYGILKGHARNLKYGDYSIEAGTTPRALLALLVSGRSRQVPVRIIEGTQFQDLMETLTQHPIVRHQLEGVDALEIMARLGEPNTPAEGCFFPDTYFTSSETSDLDVLRKARSRMLRILEEEWVGRAPDLPLETPYQGLILASIIEKETGLEAERPAIAGVFVRRLKLGMRLQTDPTVIYGLGPAFGGNLRKEDLQRDTPYNTYLHKGLPLSLIHI